LYTPILTSTPLWTAVCLEVFPQRLGAIARLEYEDMGDDSDDPEGGGPSRLLSFGGLTLAPSLRELKLERIGDSGASALAAALEKNTSVTTLYFGGNQIGDSWASALAAALEKNTRGH
jgi:hypothetical protein